jgi:3-oxoacyl-(acyl-carrier-protein) reductase
MLIALNLSVLNSPDAVRKAMGWELAKVNVNGGAIALGHSIGASVRRIPVTSLQEMHSYKRSHFMAESSGIGSTSNISGPATDSLKGRVALVTGGSRGIGRAISLELARNGAAVAVNFVSNAAAAEAVAADIRAMGGECLLVQGDVSKKEAARSVVGKIQEAWKKIDILVNNAGITRDRTMKKMTDEDWEAVIAVNLNGTYYCTAAAMPAMIEQKFGRIINIASIVGETGAFGQSNYASSKGGIIAFTKCLALELAKEGITANVVAPGYTGTEMVEAMPQEVLDKICARIPLRRLARPEEVAKAVLFLARDADYITGFTLDVNGGLYMP